MAEEKINKLQMYEQSLQNLLMQKQQFQLQLVEIESALKELDSATTSYKIIANIMVNTPKDDLKKDLESKKESLKVRISSIEKQENQLKEKAQALQSEVLKEMKDKKE